MVAAKQDALRARGEELAQERVAPHAHRQQDTVKRLFELPERVRTTIHGREYIHEHDLAIDMLEVVAKEGSHHMRLVSLETPDHQFGEAVSPAATCPGFNASGANVRAGEPARSPGIRKRPGGVVATASGPARNASR